MPDRSFSEATLFTERDDVERIKQNLDSIRSYSSLFTVSDDGEASGLPWND